MDSWLLDSELLVESEVLDSESADPETVLLVFVTLSVGALFCVAVADVAVAATCGLWPSLEKVSDASL